MRGKEERVNKHAVQANKVLKLLNLLPVAQRAISRKCPKQVFVVYFYIFYCFCFGKYRENTESAKDGEKKCRLHFSSFSWLTAKKGAEDKAG